MTTLQNRIYIDYANDVLSNKIPACEAIQLACRRFIDWFNRDDIYFDYDDVDGKIAFIFKLKHSTGQHYGQHFELLPWQQFCIANIFGWKWSETGFRVTKNVFIMISRKAGKTAFAAAIAICCAIKDNEPNAEVELVANSRQQAKIAFKHCSNFCESVDPNKKIFRRLRDNIEIPRVKSTIQVLSSDAMGNDGYNASCFIIDEFHAAKNLDLYNVMKSSQGMRRQPLGIIITTAGFLLSGYPCYDMRKTCMEVLRGLKHDDTQFTAIFELDEGDNWKDEKNWIKCAPSLGQTVYKTYLKEQVQAATNNVSLEVGVKTKNFNMFCQSADVWITDDYIQKVSKRVDLKKLDGDICYMGVDLSSVSDLTSISLLFPPNKKREYYPDKFIFKSKVYVPQEALEVSVNSDKYKEWKRYKIVDVTAGNVVDYDYILIDQKDVMQHTYLFGVYYDTYNATQWAINATNEGLPLEPFSQALGNFNKPTKLLEMLIKSGRVIIDDNPCVRWCFGNVELKFDWNDNCKPIKSGGDKNKKIDPVISMLQALGGYLNSPNYSPEIFVI